jgi:hypothetical protein
MWSLGENEFLLVDTKHLVSSSTILDSHEHLELSCVWFCIVYFCVYLLIYVFIYFWQIYSACSSYIHYHLNLYTLMILNVDHSMHLFKWCVCVCVCLMF